ncbi:MAG: RHS repeat-associated core domain-containing protein, partial [Fibrobacter sp.]|nr:RHS repeat-associated core domain-containing protein [Fibrobacter sp.]
MRVGPGETYSTIIDAISAIPQPATDNVRIQVVIPAGGYEDSMYIDIDSLVMGSFDIIIEGEDQSAITYYIGDDIEYRDLGGTAEIIENVIGSELIARRIHGNKFEDSTEYQYFIKNHLGSTVTLVDEDGLRVGSIYDYFPYGKQVEETPSSEPLATQTFTGKELDLFEKDAPDGEDGEGWYYFGVRYYDADVGRWISTDPAGQFFDLYAYAGNGFNPIIATDPTGSILKIQGSFQFRREARSAIKTLESKPIGNALVNTLRKSDNKFVITNKLTDFQSAVQNLLKKPYNGAPYENLENSRNSKGAGGTATLSLQDVELSTVEGPQLAPL